MNPILDNSIDLESTDRSTLIEYVREAVALRQFQLSLIQYPFGFVRFPFEIERNKEGMALHIWLDDFSEQETIHTHAFDLESRVLLGGITNYLWKNGESPESAHYRKIDVAHTEHQRKLKSGAATSPLEQYTATTHTSEEKSFYRIQRGALHSTSARHGTITLIRRLNFGTDSAVLFVPSGDMRDIPIRTMEKNRRDVIERALATLVS
jgi:hypothetical protein